MKKIWDIPGGVHPPENKQQSLRSALQQLPLPPRLILPLSQHIGVPARACVEPGQAVLKGQQIATAQGAMSVPVHAPSSGTVLAIEDRPIPHQSGLNDTCIVIETDGMDKWYQLNPIPDFTQLSQRELIDVIHQAGICGMGGAGFPTGVKLTREDSVEIDTLIINGTECEPYITADHALMREKSELLAQGIGILVHLVNPDRVLVGIEDNKMDVVATVRQALDRQDFTRIANKPVSVDVLTFPTKYPSGGEKQLIQILTGKEVPSGKLPSALGIVCHNMGTAVAIKHAVIDGIPFISRVTTVTGQAVKQPNNFDVLLGTPIDYLLQQTGYDASLANRVIMGGPMMGFALQNLESPVVKTTNCILAPSTDELPLPPPAKACIRCGLCAETCPASLLPQQLFWFSQGKELDKLEAHNLADCIECGACAYVCPSHIPLVQYYRASKAEIRQRDADMRNAEHSKQRFEARQQRLERLEQEKIAARQARREKAAANKNAKDQQNAKAATIAAAMERVKAKKKGASSTQSAADSGEDIPVKVTTDDPVARAIAARNAQKEVRATDPRVQLEQAVDAARKRLKKARDRLDHAQKTNDENIDLFSNAVEKAERKLQSATDALSALDKAKPV